MMKDKIEKTGHKKWYYRTRLVLGVFLLGVCFVSLAAIPVGITYKIAENELRATQEHSEEDSENEVSSSFDTKKEECNN